MRKLSLLCILAAGAFILSNCSATKKAASKEPAKLSYAANIQPLVAEKCSPCHFPDKGRVKPLNTFAAIKDNADEIIRRIKLHPGERGFMPMKRERLSDSTIAIFEQWKAQGLAE